jgi:hypothetical protein
MHEVIYVSSRHSVDTVEVSVVLLPIFKKLSAKENFGDGKIFHVTFKKGKRQIVEITG